MPHHSPGTTRQAPPGLLRRVDWYIVALFCVIGLAALAPADGAAAEGVSLTARLAVGLLFFLYGARLSPRAALDGVRHWRLHLPVLALTFLVLPAAGLAAGLLPESVLGAELAAGVLYLTVLPSTVQSSIAFTSMARGNVAAAICSASFSTVLGVVLTPLLAVTLLRHTGTGPAAGPGGLPITPTQLTDIAVQLLVPFLAGQALRRWIADWLGRHRALTTLCDRGSILLVVYSAFSHGMTAGIWHRVPPPRLLLLAAVCLALLGLALFLANGTARLIRLPRADRVTAVFCGSNKSLASGLPMATVLFPPDRIGVMVLPLMLYHTLQLVLCAYLARRWPSPPPTPAPPETVATATAH
ncbi:bile acid:sodium symporter [Streptomyces sp. BHT-5-2]|uniref:bile acid:sodium symporter family protein n=1 Tax=Streptomyces sp. BHT-5-2 TaxID=2866715 RepID=UPI001C8D7E6D|nr:bile acid:sodium symporter family protein [Streptomyces sp. BHT-5-2]QZL05217.1 bile acid:sodium symporter [Streptomyces sp. BHT-5-2]